MISGQDIFDQLKKEHEEVKALIKKAEDAEVSDRESRLRAIEKELVPHARAEERVLYNVLNERADESEEETIDLINEAFDEHAKVDEIMGELKNMEVDDEAWLAKLDELKEHLEHHIEEEESEVFSKAKNLLSSDEVEGLLESYKNAKVDFEDSLPTQAEAHTRAGRLDESFDEPPRAVGE